MASLHSRELSHPEKLLLLVKHMCAQVSRQSFKNIPRNRKKITLAIANPNLLLSVETILLPMVVVVVVMMMVVEVEEEEEVAVNLSVTVIQNVY